MQQHRTHTLVRKQQFYATIAELNLWNYFLSAISSNIQNVNFKNLVKLKLITFISKSATPNFENLTKNQCIRCAPIAQWFHLTKLTTVAEIKTYLLQFTNQTDAAADAELDYQCDQKVYSKFHQKNFTRYNEMKFTTMKIWRKL